MSGWWQRLELGRRVALLAAVAVGLAVTLTTLAAYVTVRRSLLAEADAALLERARGAASSPLGDPVQLARLPVDALGAADVRIAVLLPDGQVVTAGRAASPVRLGDAELAVAQGAAAESVSVQDVGGEAFRVVAVPARGGGALVFAQSTAREQDVLARLGLVCLLVGGAGVLLAGWAGLAVARAGLRPVERVRVAAEHVAATGRLDPIDVPGGGELGRLAAAFNAMLAALAASQDRQRALVADAGHELRTPLTSLRTNLDLLAQSERAGAGLEPAERDALITDVRAQVEELSTLVADLVELARDEPVDVADEPLDLADVVRRSLERVRRRAPRVAFAADLRAWPVCGDAQQLDRAVTNLLDNAAKWSPDGGVVDVALRDGTLSVADEGPGIPTDDVAHVFERFWRSPEARGRPGSGLGLAIVAQVAARHGGSVSAGRSPRGGALLTLRLPARTPAGSGRNTPS